MFNVEQFGNDMNRISIHGNGIVNYGKTHAYLYLFTPCQMSQQVLRPYKYNFSGNLIDEIVTAKNSLVRSVAPNGLGLCSEEINTSILPTANGIPLDLDAINRSWTFVLIADLIPPTFEGRALKSPSKRVISTGYCVDEPINPLTMHSSNPTPNPNCVLMFTKSTQTNIQTTYTANGPYTNITHSHDVDMINELNGIVANQDMYAGTPNDIRSMVCSSGLTTDGVIAGSYGDLSLNNVKPERNSRMVSGLYKTPKELLTDITDSIDRSIRFASSTTNGARNALNINNVGSSEDMADIAKAAFNTSVASSNTLIPKAGIDTTKPILLRDLMFLYPDLDICPNSLPLSPFWSSSPQDAISARNTLSSMVASSLSNMLPACGVSTAYFTMRSYTKEGMRIIPGRAQWSIHQFEFVTDVLSPAQQSANISMFETYFETNLMPALRMIRGEFDLMVYANMMGYVLVDLVFCDDALTIKSGAAFYETSTSLGGLTNPMVANLEILNHNALQLDALLEGVIQKKIEPIKGMRPIISSEYDNIPYGTYPDVAMEMYPEQIPQIQQPNKQNTEQQNTYKQRNVATNNQSNVDYSSLL